MTPPSISLAPEQRSALSAQVLTWLSQNKVSIPKGFELVVNVNLRPASLCIIEIGPTDFDDILCQPLDQFLEKQIREQKAVRLLGPLMNNLCGGPDPVTLGMLVRRPPHTLLKQRNFGQKGLNLLSNILSKMGIELGAKYPLGPKEKKALWGKTVSVGPYTNLRDLVDNPPSLKVFTDHWYAKEGSTELRLHLCLQELAFCGIVLH